ncbi:hypothetical protein Sango_1197300 [Sesamum angolense]|uniref:Uncharacterized protein n=1 Tax=Sesamum angolense TaxID=2727404 RepID=A0AAE1WWG5_9LAMI|nr:hypothetical protein Sango_1197300 [Sesamum angolense]
MVRLMLGSNCICRLPRRPILPTSTPGFRASKLSSTSPYPEALSFRVPDGHRSPNSSSAKEILHELDEAEIKPNVEEETGNLHGQVSVLRRVCKLGHGTSFQVLDTFFGEIGKPWTVPWTAETILQVTLLWIISFWFVGSWMIPFGAPHIFGVSKESLTFRGQALFSLLTDVTEGLAGILILHRCLSRFRPLPSDWFRFSLRGKWIFDVLLGCLMFPLVNRLSQFNLNLLPVLQSTPFTLSSVEQSIMARDPIAMGLYALVLVVCAPLWEEIVFREDVTTDFSWGCDGRIVCKVKEPIAIDAPAQPVERLRILGFNEMKFFFLVKSISSKLETERDLQRLQYIGCNIELDCANCKSVEGVDSVLSKCKAMTAFCVNLAYGQNFFSNGE